MRTIEVLIAPTGEATLQTRGYTGADCLRASKWLERSLGIATADQKTPEYFQAEQGSQQLPATGGGQE
jgi:hypothetical protein